MGINSILWLYIPMQVYFRFILLDFALFAGYKFERKTFKLFIGGILQAMLAVCRGI